MKETNKKLEKRSFTCKRRDAKRFWKKKKKIYGTKTPFGLSLFWAY